MGTGDMTNKDDLLQACKQELLNLESTLYKVLNRRQEVLNQIAALEAVKDKEEVK